MQIWFKTPSLEDINSLCKNTLMEHLKIEVIEVGEDYLRGQMPVEHYTVQPARLLHGGASAALAESLGSIAAYLTVNPETHACLGVNLDITHIKAIPERKGPVIGIARPAKLGNTLQVWNITMETESGQTVAESRLTLYVRALKKA
jgi:1,4-dihydroxy-2-naphthoyl-CoA hydrolase